MWWWALVPLGYVVGSIPWGLIMVRLSRRLDIRTLGSGRTGVTNVLRAAGKTAAATVLLLDAGKGFAMTLGARAATDDTVVHAAAAAAVIVGHIWPVFAGFRGGRGIATGVGTSAALHPLAALAGIAAFIPVVALTRYVSLGSMVAVLAAVIGFVGITLTGGPIAYLGYALAGGALIIWMHRDNMARLLQGTELRLGERAT